MIIYASLKFVLKNPDDVKMQSVLSAFFDAVSNITASAIQAKARRDEKSASTVASCRKVSSRNKRAISLRPSILLFPHRCPRPFDRIRIVHGTRVSKVNPLYMRLHGTRYRHLVNQEEEVVAFGRTHALIKRTYFVVVVAARLSRVRTYRNIDRKHFARASFTRKHTLNNRIIFNANTYDE